MGKKKQKRKAAGQLTSSQAATLEVEVIRRAFSELGLDSPAAAVLERSNDVRASVRDELFPWYAEKLNRETAFREKYSVGDTSNVVDTMGISAVILMVCLILYAARSDLWPSRFPPPKRDRSLNNSKSG
jgi:hypothetical protein